MRYVLIRTQGHPVDAGRAPNLDYHEQRTIDALAQLVKQGHVVEFIEGHRLTEDELEELSADACRGLEAPPHKNGRQLGHPFGTNTDPWLDFGVGIPVLLVYDDDERCVDVYPHLESERTLTINGYLSRAVRQFESHENG